MKRTYTRAEHHELYHDLCLAVTAAELRAYEIFRDMGHDLTTAMNEAAEAVSGAREALVYFEALCPKS